MRLLKIDAELTTNALQHRLTQARVVGLVQTAKVMGLQTVAKRVLGGDHSNWLTALGVDFVQSFEASPPVALDSLLVRHVRANAHIGKRRLRAGVHQINKRRRLG